MTIETRKRSNVSPTKSVALGETTNSPCACPTALPICRDIPQKRRSKRERLIPLACFNVFAFCTTCFAVAALIRQKYERPSFLRSSTVGDVKEEPSSPVPIPLEQDSQPSDGIVVDNVQDKLELFHSIDNVYDKFEPFHTIGLSPENDKSCAPLNAKKVTYTLVTQSSMNRLWMMEHHCSRWGPHPISIAVLTNSTRQEVEGALENFGCDLSLVSVSVLSHYSMEDYPVNTLRNVAMAAVTTSHVVYVDIDFWPSEDLFDILNQTPIRRHLSDDPQRALVVPAFQLRRQCRGYRDCRRKNLPNMPRNQASLFHGVRERKVFRFDPTNLGGHGSTLYQEWIGQASHAVIPIPCFLSNRYEPYLVFRLCDSVPMFQEAFSGYGKNKMTWVMELRRIGWTFWQLGGAFLVHYPHLESQSRHLWNGGIHGEQVPRPDDDSVDFGAYKRGRNDMIYLEFREWLLRRVPDQSVVHLCDNALDDDSKLWVPRERLEKLIHEEEQAKQQRQRKVEADPPADEI